MRRGGLSIILVCINLIVLGQDSKNMTLLKQWTSPQATGYNDCWGYSADGREYAILGSDWGTHFIDVSDDLTEAVEVASFEGMSNDVNWRDFKTYSHYAYGVADGDTNSLQIFDLQYLPDSVLKVYDSRTLSASSHNIFIEGDRLYLCANQIVQNKDNQALHVMSLANPELPTELRAFDKSYFGDQLLHDIHVRDGIAYCSAGYGGLFIYDLTDVNNEVLLAVIDIYPEQGYNHSSWLSNDKSKLVVADEVPSGLALKLFDVSDLDNIEYLDQFRSHQGATPHNPFMRDNFIFVSYYLDGVVTFDFTEKYDVKKVGWYDTFPDDTTYQNTNPYGGCWGTYPYLPSKNIIGSDRTYGLFVLQFDEQAVLSTPSLITEKKTVIMPNPIYTDHINITSEETITSLTLIDLSGKVLISQPALQPVQQQRLSVSQLPAGMYTLHIRYENGGTETQKIIRN